MPLSDNYSNDIAVAEQRFLDRTRNLLPVEFVRVNKIERTKRGKLRYVVSEIE